MSWNLVADIGGTNMRLAGGRDGVFKIKASHPTTGEVRLDAAIEKIIKQMGSKPARIAIAAAGIVNQGTVRLTNEGSLISIEHLRKITGVDDCSILNDFEAAAWSLADVVEDDLVILQGSKGLQKGNRIVVGPGTGLGVGGLVFDGGRPVIVKGEGGHVRLSPDNGGEIEIFRHLIENWPQTQMGNGHAVEAEAILSGTGLPYFYRAVASFRNIGVEEKSAAQIFASAKAGDDHVARETIHLFVKYLGALTGDMGVTFAAMGGVFLVGGVINANPWIFDDEVFLQAFNAGGRHSDFRQNIPVYAYQSQSFGLAGALAYLHHN